MDYLGVSKIIVIIVVLGWLTIWIMIPTKTYKEEWIPKLESKLDTTYLGGLGTNLFLLSFPMVFVACIGCIYIHMNKKLDSKSNSLIYPSMAFWKRPIVVMNSLGIISVTELIFVIMFIALLIWSLANYLKYSFGHLHMDRSGEKIWQSKFRSVCLRIGYLANICWAFIFFPVTRGSSVLPLVGLTSESSIKYHIWLGHLAMLLGALHSVGFVIYWAMTDQMPLMLEWTRHWVPNVAGEIAFVVSIPMWATSFALIRRKKFEVFYYTHHLYILFAFFYILHVGAAYLCMILPGIFLFLIDRYLRFLQSRGRVRLDSARLLPCEIIELNFAKNPGLQYNPTSILFINIPQISKLQWHPFTVTSNSNLEPNRLSIAIKSAGDWTRKLYQELSSSSCPDSLQVSIEGPYGPTSSHFLRHESLVLISGGSGITTFISIIREIIVLSNKPSARVPHVLLICSFKHAADLGLLDLLLPIDSNHLGGISNDLMQIQAYVTRDTEPPMTDDGKLVRTKRFKLNPSDSPIDAALGPNNWIWLCAIILSSFVLFVVLLGLVTRYHIYPIDHNTGQKYHFTLWCLWVVLFMFAGVFAATSCVFLWQKRKVAAQGKQVQNAVAAAPETSPETRFCGGDEEVESQPHQSLVQATQVHYGGRPNIRKILLEHKGCDVGVIASGPREMRNEVAKLCSSHAANNLHFGCTSFTW